MPENLEERTEPEKKTRKHEPVKIEPERTYTGKPKEQVLQFDPALPWYHSHNMRVAKSRGWRFVGDFYVDEKGYAVADEEGNPLFKR
jgi:hypothetical protein